MMQGIVLRAILGLSLWGASVAWPGDATAGARELTHAETLGVMEETAKQADLQLNYAYRKLMASLDKDSQAELKAAQLAWIRSRDTWCTFVSTKYRGGTSARDLFLEEFTRMTSDRARDLAFQARFRDLPVSPKDWP